MTDAAPNPVNDSKAALRKRMRALLDSLTEPQRQAASAAACARLAGLDAFRNASTVMLYLPLTAEVDATPLALQCFRTGKTVCVPRVDWQRKEMQPVETTSLDDRVMDTDEHGVRCPRIAHPIMPRLIDMVVVPGLAFDAQGNRLGRGGGYYDRFLTRLRDNVVMVGLAFDQQIVDQIPKAKHDIVMDLVVTDRRVAQGSTSRNRHQF